jgi:hypothetical protein
MKIRLGGQVVELREDLIEAVARTHCAGSRAAPVGAAQLGVSCGERKIHCGMVQRRGE